MLSPVLVLTSHWWIVWFKNWVCKYSLKIANVASGLKPRLPWPSHLHTNHSPTASLLICIDTLENSYQYIKGIWEAVLWGDATPSHCFQAILDPDREHVCFRATFQDKSEGKLCAVYASKYDLCDSEWFFILTLNCHVTWFLYLFSDKVFSVGVPSAAVLRDSWMFSLNQSVTSFLKD